MKNLVEVEPAIPGNGEKPSVGPTYRNVFAKDGFPAEPHGVNSCWDFFRLAVEKYPNNKMLGRRPIIDGKAGDYTWLTYKEAYDTAIKIGTSIRSKGIGKGEKCGIYGANSPEWIMTMEACNAHGIYCVPLYDSLGANAIEFIINHAELQIVFAEEKKVFQVIKTIPQTSEYLKTIVSFGKVTEDQREEVKKHGLSIYSWDEFLILGDGHNYEFPKVQKSDLCTIMYTSGTTGDPKGVMLSNESLICMISGMDSVLQTVNQELTDKDVYLSYLPLAHAFDRIFEEWFISRGAAIGFWRGDVKLLVEDLGVLKPTIFCAVPRVLDRIYSGLTAKISTGGLLKKTLFNFSLNHKLGSMRKGVGQEKAAPFFDKLVFSKVKEGLGGKVRFIVSGAAPLAKHVEEFLRVVSCSFVVQGYGLTETCAGSFISLPNEMGMLGTVGPPVQNIEVRLESVPEMEYDALGDTPRGEICIRGRTLFSGYYKRDDLVKEVMIDGWFHTGDIGEWQPDGSLKVIDRKKNIFKLSQGEYVAVENLENVYGLVPDLDMIWVYGNSFESCLVAVVNPNEQALKRWAGNNGIDGEDFAALCANPKAKEYILGELTKLAKEKKLKGYEFIKAVHLEPVPFDIERDLLTPTYKKKRPQMLKYYQTVIDDLYKSTK
ncbi:Long-Chain Acyl-CoA Synthetase [Rhynchospora pubera]|uniref:Long-chain-fatty-acid--CoA ligase n=2 Tax=Rhynchospora pubera TaxID=906938 RepID=A0AAV8G1H6_9POAL|nr:Long-Chain Acyl-CoA Synthetase [Rhynchospora pubera]